MNLIRLLQGPLVLSALLASSVVATAAAQPAVSSARTITETQLERARRLLRQSSLRVNHRSASPAAAAEVAPRPTAVTAVSSTQALPGEVVESYILNAQYRGGVKKGFPNIGTGTGRYLPGDQNQFEVKLDGKVENPDDHRLYEFRLDMAFRMIGNNIQVVRNGNHYSDNADDYKDRVEKVIPFVHLVKFSPMPRQGEEPARSFRYKGEEFSLRYVYTEKHVEASLYEQDNLVGKFFMTRDQRQLPLSFEKFRVPTPGDVVLSFVRQ